MRIAIFPGSFNPPTLGHLDIIQRASKLCERLIVAVFDNPNKPNSFFSADEKVQLLSAICSPFPNVEVIVCKGLLVDNMNNASVIIRGLRTSGDFEFEAQMAAANHTMSGAETLFLTSSPKYAQISSTLVREIGAFGKRLKGFVPEEIEERVFNKLSTQDRRRQ